MAEAEAPKAAAATEAKGGTTRREFMERIPWVGLMLECHITHKCAIENELLMILCDGQIGLSPATLEKLSETAHSNSS